MSPSTSAELLGGSLEGSLRHPETVRPVGADRTLPQDQPAHVEPPGAPVRGGDGADQTRDGEPLVLYGRLGYIARSAIERD